MQIIAYFIGMPNYLLYESETTVLQCEPSSVDYVGVLKIGLYEIQFMAWPSIQLSIWDNRYSLLHMVNIMV